MALNVIFRLLETTQLIFKLFLLARELALVMFKSPDSLFLLVKLAALLIKQVILWVQLLQVSLKVEVASLKTSDTPLRLIFNLFDLLAKCSYLDLVLFETILRHFQILEQFEILALMLIKLGDILLQSVEHTHLDELFEGEVLVWTILELKVGLFGDQ